LVLPDREKTSWQFFMVAEFVTADGTVIRSKTSQHRRRTYSRSEIFLVPRTNRRHHVSQRTLDEMQNDMKRRRPREVIAPTSKVITEAPAGKPTSEPQILYQSPAVITPLFPETVTPPVPSAEPYVHVEINSLTPEQMLTPSQKALLARIRRVPPLHMSIALRRETRRTNSRRLAS